MILETKPFNREIKRGNLNPFDQREIVICSYHFAKSKDSYIKEVNWDLVVIDEAHHLRNVYKTTNRIANTVKDAVAHAPKILLTATPLQNSLLELYGLVSVIDDYAFGDLKSHPDFVVETGSAIYMIETKKEGDIETAEVREKTEAAILYCKNATEFTALHGGKPWKYVLIPHNAVMVNMSFEALARKFEVQDIS
jgi:SNF2 family DNA or RNA helicase